MTMKWSKVRISTLRLLVAEGRGGRNVGLISVPIPSFEPLTEHARTHTGDA